MANMHHVQLVDIDSQGCTQGGIDFWHVPGSDIYLYQHWTRYATGPKFGQTFPDPVLSDPENISDLLHTVRECWLQPWLVFKNPAYPVDIDYR